MFPTPEFNTGLGFHYFPDDAHYRAADSKAWIPELKALGASWLTLVGSPSRAIPEPFIRALIEAAIEPVIHLAIPPSEPVNLKELDPIYSSYAKWGVHYVVLYNQPNARRNWHIDEWATSGLVGHFIDRLLPALQLARNTGLVPVFPPLKQGGDYWDTAFLDTALHLLKQRGQTHLLKETAFAYYAFALNRPPEWGAGGAARWPQTKPYSAPPGSQDQRGFRSFEWYQEVIKARLGEPRPLLMIAGGARLGDADDLDYPAVDEARHTTCNTQIMQAMLNRQLPDYVMNVSFWLLSAPQNTLDEATAWYKADGRTLPAASAMKGQVAEAMQAVAAVEKSAKKAARPKSPRPKPIFHYLLLPTFEWGVSDWHYSAAMEYIHKFKPTCGFSLDEAQAAEYVTIIGNEQGVSVNNEQALRAAGCKVDRVCGRDGDETQTRLNEMARTGTRFLSWENTDTQCLRETNS
jgi:hypothetical protein